MRIVVVALLAVSLAATVSACGRKGPLEPVESAQSN